MYDFKIGDRVIMSKPVPNCRWYKGVIGVITDMDEWRIPILQIDVLGYNRWYTADQFELFNPILENK